MVIILNHMYVIQWQNKYVLKYFVHIKIPLVYCPKSGGYFSFVDIYGTLLVV